MDSYNKLNKFTVFLVLSVMYLQTTISALPANSQDKPYFRVTYEIPKMPEEVYSKTAAERNLNIYKQHIKKNKLIMAETAQQLKNRKNFVKQHNKITEDILKDDRREHVRFKLNDNDKSVIVTLLPAENKVLSYKPVDISRKGLGLYSSNLNINDEVPVLIKYKNTEIKTTLKIVSKDKERVGGEFTHLNDETSSKLVYLSSLLESDNGILKTKLAPMRVY